MTATKEIIDIVDEIKITTGENVSFARGVVLVGGSFSFYLHHDAKLAVMMQYEGELDEQVGKEICQHIAAYVPTPMAVDQAGVCPGADRRYALDITKARTELHYNPRAIAGHHFEAAFRDTIRWYLTNDQWWKSVMDGQYREWVALNYDNR